MRITTVHRLILVSILLIAMHLSIGCLDSPPIIPERNNPWDPENPNPPRPPDGFTVFPQSETVVELSWRDRSGNEDGFRIFETIGTEEGMHVAAVVTADVDNLVLTERPRKDSLKYYIESFNESGKSYLSPPIKTSTLEAPPMPPLAFEASSEPDSVVKLTWVDDSDIEDKFEIEQSLGNPSAFHLVVTTPADCTSWELKSLNPDAIYFFRIRAGNIYGKSIYAESSGVRPGG